MLERRRKAGAAMYAQRRKRGKMERREKGWNGEKDSSAEMKDRESLVYVDMGFGEKIKGKKYKIRNK